MISSGPSLEQLKQSMRASWMAGDFGVIAKTVSKGAEAFAAHLPVAPGDRVLDVACGTGNLAIPLARRGALVTGLDLAPNLLLQATERAAAERLAIRFDEGDAEAMPYPDGSFDVVVSMFGAMFAPRPQVVADEMARVLRPGGLLAMANWTPASFSGLMFKAQSRHAPPPPGVAPPVLWGDASTAQERLSGCFTGLRTELVSIDFDMAMNAVEAVEFFRTYFGPTRMAFSRLDQTGQTALAAEMESLWSGANVARDPQHHMLVHNEYLQILATRR